MLFYCLPLLYELCIRTEHGTFPSFWICKKLLWQHIVNMFAFCLLCLCACIQHAEKLFHGIIYPYESLLIPWTMIKKNPAFSHSILRWSTAHHCKQFESICVPGQLRMTHPLWVLCCLLSREDWKEEEGWFIISLLKGLMPHHLVPAVGKYWRQLKHQKTNKKLSGHINE